MNGNRQFMGPVLLVVGLSFGLAGCGGSGDSKTAENGNGKRAAKSESVDLSTPEATLAAAKKAAAAHDYRALCGYFTPTARKDLAAGMVMLGGMVQAMAKNVLKNPQAKDSPDTENAQKQAEAIKTLFEKYDLGEDNRTEIKINLNDSQEDQKKEMRKLADPIKDHCGFFADFVEVMRTHGDQPDAKMIEAEAQLDGLKTEGDEASAEFVQKRNGKESRSPIAFQKIDGQWLISEVPNLLN